MFFEENKSLFESNLFHTIARIQQASEGRFQTFTTTDRASEKKTKTNQNQNTTSKSHRATKAQMV